MIRQHLDGVHLGCMYTYSAGMNGQKIILQTESKSQYRNNVYNIKAMFTEGMAFRLNLIGRFALVNIALIRRQNMYTSATEACKEVSHRASCKVGRQSRRPPARWPLMGHEARAMIRMAGSMLPGFEVCDTARCMCISVLARRTAQHRCIRMGSSRSRLANCCIGIRFVVQQRDTSNHFCSSFDLYDLFIGPSDT